jgi:hypothetical protein
MTWYIPLKVYSERSALIRAVHDQGLGRQSRWRRLDTEVYDLRGVCN